MNRPRILRDPFLIGEFSGPIISIDYEYSTRTGDPTVLGLTDSSSMMTVSTTQEEGHSQLLKLLDRAPNVKWLGHNFCGAEGEVWKKLGIFNRIKPEQILDTIAIHYLLNMHLCKASKKSSDEEEDTRRGRGFMNLFSMCSLYTDCENWKECVGEEQCLSEGRACPDHNVFEYNGTDTYWPLVAYPKMWRQAQLRGVDRLYPLHRDLLLVLQKVKERGVYVDVPYVDEKLRKSFSEDCERLRASLPFNPNSSQQISAHFKSKGIRLEDTQEQTIRDAAEDYEDGELDSLLEYKELGKGPDRWFAPREWDSTKNKWKGYVDENGYIHCSLGIFTSSGRFNCTGPNLQNVAKRRKDRKTGESLGKRVRRAIVAPEGYYLYRCDYKAAEYRTFLTLAGYRDIPTNMDFHEWMAGVMSIKEDDPFAMALGGPRDAAKSVMFGTIYLEGLKLVTAQELKKPKMLKEIAVGARLVFPEWRLFDKTVTFTGINLARRALGGATLENRAKALGYVQKIFKEFPKARELQIRLTKGVEKDRQVRTVTGYVVQSYGYEEDRLKTAAAIHGSNPVAQFIKYAMIRYDQHPILNEANVLTVHDEALCYVDCRHEPKKVEGWLREVMEFALPELPVLRIPIDCSFGRTWADQEEIR